MLDVFDPVDTVPPIITSPNTLSIPENAIFTQTLTANEPVVWSITGGVDLALFSLAGSILSLAAKDFEVPVDSDHNNQYVVQVTATDLSGNATTQVITVGVTAVNEFAPIINSNGGGATATVSVNENTPCSHDGCCHRCRY